ncbi:unnamed protein product [Arctogadus glacialis]
MVLWETLMAVGGFTLCDHRTEDRGRPCLAAGSSHQEVTLCDHNHHTLNGSTGGPPASAPPSLRGKAPVYATDPHPGSPLNDVRAVLHFLPFYSALHNVVSDRPAVEAREK